MKKRGLLFVVAVLVPAATFYGGFFLGRTPPERRDIPNAPPADYRTYPGSRSIPHSGSDTNVSALSVSPASCEELATFYHRQICTSNSLAIDFDPTRRGSTAAGFSSGDDCFAADDMHPTATEPSARSESSTSAFARRATTWLSSSTAQQG
jgi:hypothetical protein